MRVRIADIKEAGLTLEFHENAESFPVLRSLAERGECLFTRPIAIQLRIAPAGDSIQVAGSIETQGEMPCSRCLKPALVVIKSSFELAYARDYAEAHQTSDEEGYEIAAEDLGLIPFSGEEIDFREAVQDQVVLALPYHPLCREQCRGLCSQCGADLNEEPCRCEPQNFNIKFAALKNLKLDK